MSHSEGVANPSEPHCQKLLVTAPQTQQLMFWLPENGADATAQTLTAPKHLR